jgi:hypothetical protein
MAYNLTTEKTWSQTLDDLAETFRKWRIAKWSVEPANPGRKAANKHQNQHERTVTLRFTRSGGETVLVSRDQDRAVDNLRALYLAVERMRLIDAAGLTDIVRQAYAQLPAPQAAAALPRSPYAVLGVQPDAPLTVCEAAWKARLKSVHPDAGGTDAQAVAVNAAMDAIRKERGG